MDKNSRMYKMEFHPIPKLVTSISLPLMISLLIQSLYNIVDSIYVSRISEQALASTSLAYPMQMLMIAVSVGTGVGVNSLLSRSFGAKNLKGAHEAATNGLFLSVLSSIIFLLIGVFLTRPFIQLFTDDALLCELSCSYLQICLLFNLGIFVATTSERLLQATGNSFLSMVAQVSGAIINVILDPILIFGYFGLPAMGVRGAAIATVIGQWGAAALSLYFNLTRNREVSLSFKGFRPNVSVIRDIYKVGAPAMAVQAMGSIMMSAMNKILIVYSATAVAFYSVYYKLHSFLFMPVSGLSQGLIPIVGFNHGAKNAKRIIAAVKFTLKIAVGIMIAGILVFVCIPKVLLSLYNASDEMILFGIPAMRILCISFLPQAISVVLGYAFSGMGNGMINLISSIMRQLLAIVYAYVISKFFGINAIWYSLLIAEYSAMVFVLLRWRKNYRLHLVPMLKNMQENEADRCA